MPRGRAVRRELRGHLGARAWTDTGAAGRERGVRPDQGGQPLSIRRPVVLVRLADRSPDPAARLFAEGARAVAQGTAPPVASALGRPLRLAMRPNQNERGAELR